MCVGAGRGSRDDPGAWRPHLKADLCQVKSYGSHDTFAGLSCLQALSAGNWQVLAGEMVQVTQRVLGLHGSTSEKCTEASEPISFTMCTKFICLRVTLESTLQGAVCVSSTKSEESEKERGRASMPRRQFGGNNSCLAKTSISPTPR